MERALQKLARQLNQYDAASLTALWERYANQVARFEPTQRWEEAALVFSMIQAVHWKNQLFNAEMLESRKRAEQGRTSQGGADQQLKNNLRAYVGEQDKRGQKNNGPEKPGRSESVDAPTGGSQGKQRRKVLLFQPRDHGQS